MTGREQELDILEEISQILGDGLDLPEIFQHAMAVLSQRLGILRASLVIHDQQEDCLKTVASTGLSPQEQQRGRYARGEGVTGTVLDTGEPAVIPDISKHPDFLNRTGARSPSETDPDAPPVSFICIPLKDASQLVGAISIDKPFVNDRQLQTDARILTIIAGLMSQAYRLHNLVQIERSHWIAQNQLLRDDLRTRYKFDNIIGTAPAMLDVLSSIAQVAESRATVLILGETGCGKELVAKAIHYNSPRRHKPLIRVNCGALAPQLLESELFGHVKGSFTGAIRDKTGRFEAADGGSIFLDEIGTLDPQLQVRLLRVLQERELERVGDHRTRQIDVRVIAATNLDLEHEVRKGNFREDLYYRLNVVTIHLPPLRNRREDIPLLVDHFLERFNRENNKNLRKVSRSLMNTLLRYPWPGNVRELENAMERAVVLSASEDFTEELLSLQIRLFAQQTRTTGSDQSIDALCARLAQQAISQHHTDEGRIYANVIQEIERHLIREALAFNDGVKIRTADFLGINRNTLNKKVRDLQLEDPENNPRN
ncbi:sigma-54-dependent Fis family transcriptional regulator [Mucisphaera calidilacus]|uniref:Nitrogen fixation protein VnfA n=1 Tax=Mucisphaera calidilacus TaxID=2527982 RepID=A0A518C0Q1_9BACT|nr:sigma 54-interacting transcriptional regulator [Mucisphaera calidilacus]QDU72802.1 Nitrogen fixation protein VnfA [Mucisphaera calidilacus]